VSNIKPQTAITIIDPKLEAKIDAVKKDTEAILKAVETQGQGKPEPVPSYFPRGYFGA